MKKGLSYDDVLLEPKRSDVTSRDHVKTWSFATPNNRIDTPIISAPMDSVTEAEMALAMQQNGGVGIIHRFLDIEKQTECVDLARGGTVGASIGIRGKWRSRAASCIEAGADFICVDVAHGHLEDALDVVEEVSKAFPDTDIMAGNVATKDGALDLVEAGADTVKVGVGPGCFARGTKVLMANGKYKNIEEIEKGEEIINKNGEPVEVLSSGKTGTKRVSEIETNKWHKKTTVTPDHKYWVGDLNGISQSTLRSNGYKHHLHTEPKRVSHRPRYKWKEIGKTEQDVSLFPNDINYQLDSSFSESLEKRTGGNYKTGHIYEEDNVLSSNYSTGYIFGTFLGDGTASMTEKTSGVVRWSFGNDEQHIAIKLKSCLNSVLDNVNPTIKNYEDENVIKVELSYNPLVKLLQNFGKRQNKHLPDEYLVSDQDYLRGLFDGLIDSDGSLKAERISFTNTSENLIELMYFLYSNLFDGIPNSKQKKKTVGNLEGADYNNLSQCYQMRYNNTTSKRITNNGYQVVKILEKEKTQREVDVYDIEVDCETHSFIANNSVVHNSHCSTRNATGVGVPQFTAIQEVHESRVWSDDEFTIVADGGIRTSGDIVKALMAGADTVMIGGLLGQCYASPGSSNVWGMASKKGKENSGVDGHIEGVESYQHQEVTVERVIDNLMDGVRSGLSYCGGHTIQEARKNAEFIEITPSTKERNGAHGMATR